MIFSTVCSRRQISGSKGRQKGPQGNQIAILMKLVEDFLDFHMFENILTSKTPYMRKANNEMQCTMVILRGLQKVNTSET